MTWNLRKLFGILTYDERIEKEEANKKALEEWRSEAENIYLKIRGSKVNESPYTTYFFKYCQHCHNFRPDDCFSNNGYIYTERVLRCSELRLTIKLLQDEPKCSCNK